MNRMVIYEDAEKMTKFYQQLQETENALQGVINRFKLATGGHCPNLPEIRSMFDQEGNFDPEGLKDAVINRLYPAKEIEIHGVMVNRKKLREIVSLPDLTQLSETLQFIAETSPGLGFFNFFQVDEEKARVKELNDRINGYTDNFRVYASGSGELGRLDQAHQVAGVFNSLVRDYQVDPERLRIPGFVCWDNQRGFSPETTFVKEGKLL